MLKKIRDNATLMSWASYLIQFGSVLFIFPLLIKVYTPLEQSFWWLLNTMVGLALLADSGFGSVLVRGVSYFNSGADYLPRTKEEFEKKVNIVSSGPNIDKLADLLTTTNKIYTYLSLLMLFLLVTAGPLIMWNVMTLAKHRLDFWIAYLILIPNCIFIIYTVRWRSFLRGLGFIAKEARINTSLGVLRLIAFVIILSFRLSPIYLVLCMFAESCFKYFYLKSLITKWFKSNQKIIINRKYFDIEIFKSLWSATYKEGLIEWGNYLLAQGNSIIIAQVSNTQLMANFLLTTRVLNVITNISQITLFSNIPKIYSFAARNDIKNMKTTAAGYMFLGMVIMVVAFIITIIFGNPALALLNKETQLLPLGILIIMVLTQLLDSHATYHAGIYISTNHVPFLLPTIISGVIFLTAGFIIMPIYGLFGIILLKFLIQVSFNNWYSVILSLRLLKWPLKNYLVEFPVIGTTFVYHKVKSFLSKG
jgi:O-antigen/teichoic acid export membrane protein